MSWIWFLVLWIIGGLTIFKRELRIGRQVSGGEKMIIFICTLLFWPIEIFVDAVVNFFNPKN